MIPVQEALKIIERETHRLEPERIDLSEAVGRVLAEKVAADTDLPPFDRSQMDGYAVVAGDTRKAPVDLKLVGESAAGRGWHQKMKRGEAVRIMTGAPLPPGADAVQKIELTTENSEASTVTILEPTEKERYIIRQGSEIKKGDVVFEPGEVITENMVAALAAFGYARVRVGKRVRAAILSTGSEIVAINQRPKPDQIRNSNSAMLAALCRKSRIEPRMLPIAGDDVAQVKASIRAGAKNADILIITGGVSVGKYDHTKTALAELGAEIFFDKLRLKPGKPMVFARLGKTLVFGLPGNPVSSAVTFYLFVRAAAMQLAGARDVHLREGVAVLAKDVKGAKERDTYLPVSLETNRRGMLIATPLKWSGSSDFIGFARSSGLAVVPAGKRLARDKTARILFF